VLPENLKRKIAAEAARRGQDPAKAVQAAERLAAASAQPTPEGPQYDAQDEEGEPGEAPARPVAERLLVGFLPFIRVRELRQHWLGLDERIPDDDLTCGEYQVKHGGGAGAAADPEAE
jgi:hypothetical protein